MSFNTDNCVVLKLNPGKAKDSNVQYQLNGEHLRSLSHQRDLGVIVDENIYMSTIYEYHTYTF